MLHALFPITPIRVERPHIPGVLRVVQVVGRDWAKSSLRIAGQAGAERRLARWCDEVASYIRADRPTLVVCTLEWEEQLRAGLAARGYSNVTL